MVCRIFFRFNTKDTKIHQMLEALGHPWGYPRIFEKPLDALLPSLSITTFNETKGKQNFNMPVDAFPVIFLIIYRTTTT